MSRCVIRFLRDVRQAVEHWLADEGPLMSAATAYYVGLSFFPLLLVLIAGVGWFLQSTNLGQDAQQQVMRTISANVSEQVADYVKQSLQVVQDKSSISGPIGFATMVIAALAAFAQLDSAFNRIWPTPQSGSESLIGSVLQLLAQRGRAFLLLFGMATLVVLVFLAGMVLSAIQSHTAEMVPLDKWVWNSLQVAITFVTNAIVFTLLYRLLPRVSIRWSEAVYGGVFTAVAWEIGRQLLAILVARSEYTSAYGVVGAFLAVLLWCYYAVAIVLLGAEYVEAIRSRARRDTAGDINAPPDPT